jgi:hypothetical protein
MTGFGVTTNRDASTMLGSRRIYRNTESIKYSSVKESKAQSDPQKCLLQSQHLRYPQLLSS